MKASDPPPWPVGARVRELGPTIFVVPVRTERPARAGTVRWSGAALSIVQWDGEPVPDLDRPPPEALALSTWLEPAPPADPTPSAGDAPAAPAAPATPSLRLVPPADASPAAARAAAVRPFLQLLRGHADRPAADLDASLTPDAPDPERTPR